ncbi:MAG: hypothetical protein DA443_03520 [Bacteroidetes bacterium]|nr:MAG: hypothetical protein DA443_03520 [Bacteroidota bacterium]
MRRPVTTIFALCLFYTLAFPGMVLPGMGFPSKAFPALPSPPLIYPPLSTSLFSSPPLSSPPLNFLQTYPDTVRTQPKPGNSTGRRIPLSQVQAAAIDEWIGEIWADAYSEEELALASRRTEEIYEMLQHPLALNRASADELMNIPWISPELAVEIVRYRNEVKPYQKKDDLMHVHGIGSKTFSRIAPFLIVDPTFRGARARYGNPRYWLHGFRSESLTHLRQTLEPQEGYLRPDSAGGYLGSPVQLYHRVRVQSDHLSVNLTLEKDAGEPLPSAFDFDYTSWHVAIRETGVISSLVVGDYSVRYGQGLVLSSTSGLGKSGLGTGVIGKATPVLRPWTSASEGGAFRGAGITLGRKVQISGFVSSRLHTAGMHADSTYRPPGHTGLHRTLSERARKDQLRQTTAGGHVRYRNAVFEAGITALKVRYAHPVSVRSSPSSPFDFHGTGADAFGADIRLSLSNWVVFAEAVTSTSRYWNSPGYILGFALRQDQIRWAWLIRSYPAHQHSLLGGGFSESSSGSNELGTLMTLRYEPTDWVEIVLLTDHYQFPHARYQKHTPSSGWELSLTGLFELFQGTKLSAGFRMTEKQRDAIGVDELGRESRHTSFHSRWNYRFQAEWSRYPRIRLRIRVDRIFAKTPDPSNGVLLFQDIRWAIFRFLHLDARITFFDATSFDARLYQYETDLLYLMSNTVLSDKGMRFYIMTRFDVGNLIQVRLKIASTRYENRNMVGSGQQVIEGRQKTDIGVQLRIRF